MRYLKQISLYLFVCIVALIRAIAMPFVLPFRSDEYRERYYIAEDQAWNTVINGNPDETASARAHRSGSRWEPIINWLFRDPNHCAQAYVSEMRGDQTASEYRNG